MGKDKEFKSRMTCLPKLGGKMECKIKRDKTYPFMIKFGGVECISEMNDISCINLSKGTKWACSQKDDTMIKCTGNGKSIEGTRITIRGGIPVERVRQVW